MLCVVCPHCHQMMTAPEDAVGESVACPSCKKSLQVPPNAPRLPRHLAPGGGPAPVPAPAPAAQAKAAAGAVAGRVGVAVAAPPLPGPPPKLVPAAPRARSTLAIGLLAVVALVMVAGAAAVVIVPRLGAKKTPVVSGKKKDPRVSTGGDTIPPDVHIPPSDLTAATLFKAYFDNALAADESYKEKSVTLSGKVAAVGGQGELFVNLYGIDRARDLTKIVRCYFPDHARDRLKTIVPNQVIRVKGTCKGMTDGRVVVRDCGFVREE